MRKTWMQGVTGIVLVAFGSIMAAVIVPTKAGQEAGGAARQAADQVSINPDNIGGVVTSSKGPEAGVWVIAETTELPTKFRKIVVTDDRGRFLLPELPKANYRVWVRGYGLVDSGGVNAMPGVHLALTAVVAPTPQAAAQYYPANYWFSLVQAPPKSAFPMNTSVSVKDGVTLPSNQGVERGAPPDADGTQHAVVPNQANWIATVKNCEICHQMGTKATREISPALGAFDSSTEAWDHRIRMGQAGGMAVRMISPLGREHAEKILADWTDEIAKGAVPPAPPRPAGVERNLVISMWDIGTPITFAHDLYTTDKRHPDSNPYGPVYLGDYNTGYLHILDPKRNADYSIKMPIRDDPGKLVQSGNVTRDMQVPSLYWGDELIYDEIQRSEVKNVDTKGRLWMATAWRGPESPAWCREGSSNKFAKYFPMDTSGRQIAYFDGKTRKETWVDTCFGNHHAAFGEDADETIYWLGNGSTVVGWVKPGVLDRGGTDEEAQGWCPSYYDVNGDGKYEKGVDKLLVGSGYYVGYNPVDKSVWYALPGTPGMIVRMDIGSNPPETCRTEAYAPPFNNPKAPGKLGYLPRGLDIDRNGLVWTGLAGSGQLASFDRSKCKVLTGPESFDPQHCVEVWKLYDVPGPQMKNVPDGGSADFLYGNWVDQFNTLGLGTNVPIANGTGSDAMLVLMPDTHKWVVLRVPYPLGFFTRNVAGRIDDASAGWKGRGLWAGNEVRNPWHQEGGKGMRSEAVHFQMRPDPLAK
ncbi:MAG: carboxypeptidase-like regulatory domain-containing protein [Candidatus Acidiferrales bacterium]